MMTPTRIRSEAKRLLDVALEAKISAGSSTYLKSMLDNVSTEFSAFQDSMEGSSRDETEDSDEEGRDSPQLSLSESHDLEATRAKKEKLIQILSAQVSTSAAARSRSTQPTESGSGGMDGAGSIAFPTGVSDFAGASQASTVDPVFAERLRAFPLPSDSSSGGSLGATTAAYYHTTSSGDDRRGSSNLTRSAYPEGGVELNRRLAEAQDTIALLTLELERHRRMAESTTDGEHMERRAVEERCKRMTSMLEAETALRRQYEDKARQFDKLTADAARLQTENEALRSTLEQQGKAVQVLAESEKAATTHAADCQRTKDLLLQDKAFLQQELRTAEARVDEKARSAESYQAKALALEVHHAY
jgi:hypothetical protein